MPCCNHLAVVKPSVCDSNQSFGVFKLSAADVKMVLDGHIRGKYRTITSHSLKLGTGKHFYQDLYYSHECSTLKISLWLNLEGPNSVKTVKILKVK